jgi:hypothetical protein
MLRISNCAVFKGFLKSAALLFHDYPHPVLLLIAVFQNKAFRADYPDFSLDYR